MAREFRIEEQAHSFRFILPPDATAEEKETYALDAAKIAEAVRQNKDVEVSNAIINGSLLLVNLTAAGSFTIEKSVIRGTFDCSQSIFQKNADIYDCTFESEFRLESAVFSRSLTVTACRFNDSVNCKYLCVNGYFNASDCSFPGSSTFNSSVFGSHVFLTNTKWGKEGETGKQDLNFISSSISGDLNFTGATFFAGVSFNSSAIGGKTFFKATVFRNTADFGHTEFARSVNFVDSFFEKKVTFNSASFKSHVHFESLEGEMIFADEVDYTRASIAGIAHFRGAQFRKNAVFNSTHVGIDAFFSPAGEKQVVFEGDADFTSFMVNDASFNRAVFKGTATFYSSNFGGSVVFNGAEFRQAASFSYCEFGKRAEFNDVQFALDANFSGTVFKSNVFFEPAQSKAVFNGNASFTKMQVAGNTHFRGTVFHGRASFNSANFEGHVFFESRQTRTIFNGEVDFIASVFHSAAVFSNTTFNSGVLFEEMQVKGDTRFFNTEFHKEIAFANASFRTLSFQDGVNRAQFGPGLKIDMRGCTYDRLSPSSSWQELVGRFDSERYDRQPFTHMENIFRKSGEEKLANQVYFERKKIEMMRKRHSNLLGFSADLIHRALTGFGVKMWRLAVIVLLLLVSGTFIFHVQGAVEPRPGLTGATVTWGEALWITLDKLLPISIPSGGNWTATYNPALLRLTYSDIETLLKIFGWIIVPTLFADLSKKILREN